MDPLIARISELDGGRILDVATGTGGFLKTLGDSFKSYETGVGIDPASDRIETAAKDADARLTFRVMDAETMAFEDGSFDTVALRHSLHHLRNADKVLGEMQRVLKPGGLMIIGEVIQDPSVEQPNSQRHLHHWWGRVDQTRGEVLVCNDSLIKANYSSTCGGRTELPENVWPDRRSGCFVSVEDTFCSVSRHYQWQEVWPAAEMERLLKKYLPAAIEDTVDTAFKLQDIKVLNRLPSGRVDTVEIVTDKGTYRFSRDPLRWVLRRPHEREPILRSSFIEVEILRGQDGRIDTVKVNGRGNGHGAGMCQWGAISRARAGHSYDAILQHFYPRAKKKKIY